MLMAVQSPAVFSATQAMHVTSLGERLVMVTVTCSVAVTLRYVTLLRHIAFD